MLQPQPIFDRIIALSPSVWVNRRSVLRIARAFRAEQGSLSGKLYLAAGALEEFNLILPGMRAFHRWIMEQDEPGLELEVAQLAWKNHFTVIRPGLRRGLEWLFS